MYASLQDLYQAIYIQVQDLVQLRKKEEKLEKAKTLASVGGGGMLPRQSTSTSMSTSSALSAHTTTSSGGWLYS